MINEQVKKIEKYLSSIKKRTPEDINFARNHLLLIKDKAKVEELLNIKILYQSKLARSPLVSNSLAIIAIMVSIITFLLNILPLTSKENTIFVGVITFIIVILMTRVHFLNNKNNRMISVYTIIINLIDEIILDKQNP